MSYAAQVAIAADRYTPCVRTITFRGLDLTGVALRMQVRLVADTPGLPLVDLSNVSNAQAQGIKLVSVSNVDNLPTSVIQIRINETTIEGLPYAGELGNTTDLAYDLQGTLGGDKRVLMAGAFAIAAGVTGANNAPLNRPFGFGSSPYAVGMRGGATLTFGETRVDIAIDGADLLAPIANAAKAYQDAAAASALAAGYSSDTAEMASATALAASNYYPTRAAGEAATPVNGLFTTGDGAGNIIYYQRTTSGSTEISRAVTPVSLAARTVRHISEFGVVPNASYDQAAAINAAFLAAASQGAIIMTKQGESYRHADTLSPPAGTIWQSNGATLIATDPIKIALYVGDNTQILGAPRFLAPNATSRSAALEASRVVIVGTRWMLDRPMVDGAASIGIMKFGCSFGLLICPNVRNTTADGIHTTYGANNNTTTYPLVENAGDDCVAYVGYSGDGRPVDNEVLIGGRGLYGHARGLTAIGVRTFTSTNWYAEGCDGAGVYTGGEDPVGPESAKSFGTSNVTIDSPTVINCCQNTTIGHAPIMVFGRDGSNPGPSGEQISGSALGTRLISPTIGGGPGAAAAVRIDYGAEGTQVLYLKARDVTNSDSAPNLVNINGYNTTLIQPEGLSIGGNGILIGPRASGFVVVDRPMMEQMGVNAPATYASFLACDAAATVSRVDVTGARFRTSASLKNLLGGVFPDGALRIIGATVDDIAQVEIDPIGERYAPGRKFDYSAAGAVKPRSLTVPASAVAQFGFAAQILAQIDIVAVQNNDQNVRTIVSEVLYFSADNTGGVAGVDYVALPDGGYYRRAVIGPVSGAAWGNLSLTQSLTIVGGHPALSIGGGAAAIDLTVRAVLTRKMG